MNKKEELKHIIIAGFVTIIGLIIFKLIPMYLYGKDILFDASAHIAIAIFVLYIGWFFINKNKSWKLPYFILSFFVLTIFALQRIVTQNHNDIGLLMGLFVGVISITISEWKYLHNKIRF